jgi:L,D-peptidoglycan transpeptidase YkuD (ErfK/YbiS/YcfS/YnhG family)
MSFKALVFICILSAVAFICNAQVLFEAMKIPSKHQQIVLVTSEEWDSQTATLQLYYKTDSSWIPTGKKVAVVLGKNGLGWGRGLHISNLSGPQKIEGDGKAPAGIFEFGGAFGYDSIPPQNLKIPYRQSTDRDYWVDAITASEYNTWVRIPKDKENNPKKYWSSYERMKRSDHLYELGAVVKHNMNPALPSKGSAIFFHVWRLAGSPTLGCTAMSKQDLKSVLVWLNPKKNPLLIQLPKKEMNKLIYSQ